MSICSIKYSADGEIFFTGFFTLPLTIKRKEREREIKNETPIERHFLKSTSNTNNNKTQQEQWLLIYTIDIIEIYTCKTNFS